MGLCWTCLDRALVGRDQQEAMAILESMQACGDPLLAVQAKKKLMELSRGREKTMAKKIHHRRSRSPSRGEIQL